MLPGCYSLVPADPAPFHYRPGLVAWELALDHHCSRDSPSYDRPLPPFKKHQKNLIPLCLGDSFQIRPIWVFPKIMVPQNGSNPIKMDDLGAPYLWKHPYKSNLFRGRKLPESSVSSFLSFHTRPPTSAPCSEPRTLRFAR